MTLKLGSHDLLTCDLLTIPCDRSNLVLQAADAFRQKSGLAFGAEIHLQKRIPIEAGLGGGSSNAATVLFGLNELVGRPLSDAKLREVAATLGSDVAFFFSRGSAYCTGRGEEIEEVPPFALMNAYIVKPSMGLTTSLVYKNLDLKRCSSLNPRDLLNSFQRGRPLYHNDMEEAALRLCPSLRKFKERLLDLGCTEVMLSGSGTSFLALSERPLPSLPFAESFKITSVGRKEGGWY